MITVTFPTGIRVTYNDATKLSWLQDRVEVLMADENKKLWIVATVLRSSGAIIEYCRPCSVTAPPIPSQDVALDTLLRQIESGMLKDAASWKLKDLKRALAKFDARSGAWRS